VDAELQFFSHRSGDYQAAGANGSMKKGRHGLDKGTFARRFRNAAFMRQRGLNSVSCRMNLAFLVGQGLPFG
jgi:hypothetical protein